PGDCQLHGARHADDTGQHPRGTMFDRESALHEDQSHPRVFGRDANVLVEAGGEAQPDARAVDGTDHRLAEAKHGCVLVAIIGTLRSKPFFLVGRGARTTPGRAGAAGRNFRQPAHVGARAVRAARTRDDDRADGGVAVGIEQRGSRFRTHGRGPRVHFFRAIEGYGRDAIRLVVDDFGEIHSFLHGWVSADQSINGRGNLTPRRVRPANQPAGYKHTQALRAASRGSRAPARVELGCFHPVALIVSYSEMVRRPLYLHAFRLAIFVALLTML